MGNSDSDFINFSDEKIENIIFRNTINNINILIYIKDIQGKYLFINKAAKALFSPYTKLYGKTDEELYSTLHNERSHNEDLQIIRDQQQTSKLEEITFPLTSEKHNFLTVKTPIFNNDNQIIALCSISKDITIEAEALNTLSDLEQRFHKIAEHTNIGIYTIENDRITYVNPKCCEISGYSYEEMTDMKLCDVIHPYDLKMVTDNINRRLKGQEKKAEYTARIVRKNKEITRIRLFGSTTVISGKTVIVGTVTDITEFVEAHEKIIHQASYDQLTNIPNRYFLSERLNISLTQAQRKNTKLAVLFIDLDRFKYINDTLGHNIGDRLLVEVARRLKRILRSSDLVARLGGDEFIIMLEQINSTYEPAEVANKVINTLAGEFIIGKHSLYIGASIGISLSPENGTTEADLIKNADTAMYEAKKKGKGRFEFYNKKLTEIASAELKHVDNLRIALQENQLYLYYQPQIDVRNGQIICLEVLIGWHHPVKGNIFPAKFIPLATESGLTARIDFWVIEKAFKQVCEWQLNGKRIPRLALNISNTNFSHNDFTVKLEELLEKYNIPAEALELYFQDEALTANYAINKEIFSTLRKSGVGIVTNYIVKMQSVRIDSDSGFSKIKIDYQTLNSISNRQKQETFLNLITSLSEIENYTVVIENVNFSSDAEYIISQGFKFMQGSFFIPPVPPEKVTEDYFITSRDNIKEESNSIIH